jgi:hypothetical protein
MIHRPVPRCLLRRCGGKGEGKGEGEGEGKGEGEGERGCGDEGRGGGEGEDAEGTRKGVVCTSSLLAAGPTAEGATTKAELALVRGRRAPQSGRLLDPQLDLRHITRRHITRRWDRHWGHH